jgi:hypothetical protein
MSDAPERIWAAPNFHTNGWGIEIEDAPTLPEGTWDLVQDGSPGEAEYILTTASPEAFAALEPVQALIAGAYEAGAEKCRERESWSSPVSESIAKLVEAEIRLMLLALTSSDALAALAAREAAAERRGWLAGMERAAGMAAADGVQLQEEADLWDRDGHKFAAQFAGEQAKAGPRIAAAIRAEMEKEG